MYIKVESILKCKIGLDLISIGVIVYISEIADCTDAENHI